MPAKVVIRAQIDPKVKADATAALAAMGLSVSDALRMLLLRVAQDGALPFDPLPNATTIAAMEEARAGKLEPVTLDQLQAEIDAEG
ncbi:type II toxin-antitoxin system RelB/DinJ family antitoxin [Cupriavidus sp. CV2]|uniref:type II toxin-antitoxin system RelB/DinJ family antitoxin n=1 Tax=Cupriavidus ulmosensis TaxID=3065913 RepID=UPI00296B5728|nr:type II toxin-antitoxin system RelB/DinJ family antitoxin [Cupriavidus sp. CV2]MDW3681621.1 type II toxin-antitoxin system RelB/DinJ family antitoxin [Cupriavidus sp. CV2]